MDDKERLIDANALKSIIMKQVKECKIKVFDPSVNIILQDIENAPTIEAQTVKHGRWLDYGRDNDWVKFYRCSVCKDEMADTSEANFVIEKYEYCPFCGARMDGESKNSAGTVGTPINMEG